MNESKPTSQKIVEMIAKELPRTLGDLNRELLCSDLRECMRLIEAEAVQAIGARLPQAVIIFKKSYHGFEDAVDIDRDISEMWDGTKELGIPGDFEGTVTVTVTYTPE